MFIVGGALLSFNAPVWYPFGPVVDGRHLLTALAGAVVLGTVVEVVYRAFIRPRQTV